MLKHIYKIIILLCIFVASVYYFGLGMSEQVFQLNKTIIMSEASFPMVSIKVEEHFINQLHGYSNNMNASLIRESVTAVGEDQSFMLFIDEDANDVKRVIIELREIKDNKLLATDTINALDKVDGKKVANVKIRTSLEEGKEYNAKITLVTSESRKMNYYSRIKKLSRNNFDTQMNFVMELHESLIDGVNHHKVESYFEEDGSQDNSSYQKVNIASDFDLTRYANLNPTKISSVLPTVTDINKEIAMVELKFIVSIDTEYGTEYFEVKEQFSVRYTLSRMFLLNYDRSMEKIFDMDHISLSQGEIKLGVGNMDSVQIVSSIDNSKIAFVRERELWYYNLTENKATKVFSFRQDNIDDVRERYDKHEVKILNLNDDGNMHFIVYGYMNRGAYEGKVGMILYEYHQTDGRIEELIYIPSNSPYDILKEEIEDFSYVSSNDVFYFGIKEHIYSFNMITKNLTLIQDDIQENQYLYLENNKYIVIQESNDMTKSKSIKLIDLESSLETSLDAKDSNNIKLLGKIDENIIVGYFKEDDITMSIDGKELTPMYEVSILSLDGNILKTYSKDGYYVSNIKVENNVVTLERLTKTTENGKVVFISTNNDNILNKLSNEVKTVGINARITDKMLKEYYLFLPKTYSIGKKPETSVTENTVIGGDTTLRIENDKVDAYQYIVYSYGSIKSTTNSLGEAIVTASKAAGTVLDKNGNLLWERRIRSINIEITGIQELKGNSKKAVSDMLIQYRAGTSIQVDKAFTNFNEYLSEYDKEAVLNLTGASLNDILYYIGLKQPVIAMKNENEAVLIIGYDQYNIIVMDPSLSKPMKIGLNDSKVMFENADNIFFTYKTK